ncbi:mechanosensitive ion channel [Candidatus Woesearchaeota archaeon]|nr:mechanosensitive ion channel [Candidatus Woesearchaeota archaeon]
MAVDPDVIGAKAWELILTYGPKLVLAILTLVIGFWIIGWVGRVIGRVMERRKVDVTLRPFLRKLATISLKVMLLISVAGMVGIEVTSFIAVIGAAGLALGLALQGSLANFAGGVLILLFKPFQVGEYIQAQGEGGTVERIEIFHTTLKTPDNKVVVMPNGPLANSNVVNFSREPTRRLDLVFGISYDDDIDKARKVLKGLMGKDKRILKEPEPAVLLSELGDSSVDLTMRVWLKAEDYWPFKFEMTEKVKKAFDKHSLTIPFPQREMRVYNYDAGKARE